MARGEARPTYLEVETFLGAVRAVGNRANGDRWRLARHLAGPSVWIPLFFNLAKGDDEGVYIFTLNIVAAVIENIDDRVVLQPQHRAGIERKTMLDRDLNSDLRNEGFGLLKRHIPVR